MTTIARIALWIENRRAAAPVGRVTIVAALSAMTMFAVLTGGCAHTNSRDWAQTSPSIAADKTALVTVDRVSLGAHRN